MKYSFTPVHVPGKYLNTADTLSRSPLPQTDDFYKLVDLYANSILESIPIKDKKMDEIQQSQHDDEVCRQIMIYCQEGWPEKHRL